MPNNIQELLKPRYKVIARYPFNDHFMLNEIIQLNEFDDRQHLSPEMKEWFVLKKRLDGTGFGTNFFESTFNQYPHLFQKLEWWEDRAPEDMPQYLKYNTRNSGDVVAKIDKYETSRFGEPYGLTTATATGKLYINYASALPATEAEYEAYLKTQTAKNEL